MRAQSANASSTDTKNAESALPAEFLTFAQDARVTIRRNGAPKPGGKCVVYWMQRAERGLNNPAVDVGVNVANILNLPLIVYFSAISNFPSANLRHYAFLNQGLPDIEADLAERNITLVVRRPPGNSLEMLLAEVDAALLIGDENPCREPERWRQVIAQRMTIPFWTVDADVVVPSRLFSKAQYGAYILRPKLHKELPKYLQPLENPKADHAWKQPKGFANFPVNADITEGWRKLDRSVAAVESFQGGSRAARKRLKYFVDHLLADYEERCNQPDVDGTSRLSPYLHFGHIGPLEVALAVDAAVKKTPRLAKARDSFFNELIIWRELAVNFVRFTSNYDSVECAENWAKESMAQHASDKRDWIYTLEAMERGETHDELWNAAQLQMVHYGWMHNYLRMYWAKKILEWSPDPARAFEYTVALNDRYELDGRDPNGYAGIAWAIVGKHDRPWFDRPIFGKIRYMSGTSTGKKFHSRKYIQHVHLNVASGQLW
jgi:deoxyribodipyrimidine photo-lyase